MDITTLPSPVVEMTEQRRRLQITQEILQEVMTLKNQNQLADASNEDLMKELLSRLLNERVVGRAVESESSNEAASHQQLKDAVAAATKEKNKSTAENNTKKPRKQKKGGGFISRKLIAFGSIMMLIFSLSLIYQIGGSGEGEAPPAMPPSSASRFLRQTKHQSNNDNAASPETIISPLPASIVVPPSIFSPAATSSNRGMKFDKLRSETCLDTPNWEDVVGDGCDYYEEYDPTCSSADAYVGDMGPAATHCCVCGGGSVSLPPTNSPTISNSPTKSAIPSTSPTNPPSTFPSISTSPTNFCLDTPNWEDKLGRGCDYYEEDYYDYGCFYADNNAGDMGPATIHCCYCHGRLQTCENLRSKCQDYFNFFGIKDGVMSPLCEQAESCSCGDNDVKIVTDTDSWGDEYNYTVGLYNECKCDFWSRLCKDSGVGEACDYAAEYCCGDYEYREDNYFSYLSNPTCYCDFFNYAQREFNYTMKPKAMNISKEFTNPCGQVEGWGRLVDIDDRASLEAIYEKTDGWNWTKNDGWMNETADHCQWYGISCSRGAGRRNYITRLDLRDNNLAGQFPVYTRNFTFLYGRSALESEWEYTKNGLANLYKLEYIDLAGNKLTGTIDHRPLYNLQSLTHFDVSGNQLSGEMDALVTPSIVHSDFSNNNFTSMRRFEKFKRSYQTLSYCDVNNNAIQINATDSLDNIPPNIEQFSAQNNQIYGSLPQSINELPQLRQFDMSSNTLSGSLSKSLNNLPQLRYFNMSSNSLSGSLPESLNNLPQLRQFDISSNTFSGQLPDFAESILTLQELDMSNQTIGFMGSIPEDLARFQSLRVLKLAGNKLKGTIPPSIGNMAVLEILDLSDNLLSSTILPELGLLEGVLKRLDLSHNNLSGRIPSQIGQLQGASVFLKGNPFKSSASAPLSLCMLSSVEVFDLANDTTLCPIERNALSDFYDSAKGGEWTDRTNWLDEYTSCCEWKGVACENDRVTKLNLRNNGLSGRMSESIGNLTSIEVLDLSDNDIKGSIPAEIGFLSNLTYLRLSYNSFTGTTPEGLGELTELKLLQLHSNRITGIPNTTRLDNSVYGNSSFVSDCGVPSAFEEPLVCEICTMCCNANEDCYPQQKTRVVKMGLNYATFAAVLFAAFVIFCSLVALFLYLYRKCKNRGNALTMSTQGDNKYALSRIGKESVYSYIITDMRLGWLGAFGTLAIQFGILILFVLVSEADLQDDKIDIEFTWKCPRNSYLCRDTADLTKFGWLIFCMLMIAFLAKDMVNGCKLIYFSSKRRHSLGSRIRYFVGGTGLCSITLFALYVSTVYNSAIATSDTDIIVNSVVVLFVMEIDEYIFSALDAISEKLTKHASDSESSVADEEARNESESSLTEMKEEIARQKTQIASQQEELGILRSQQEELMLQRDQVERQNDEIAMLRGIVQQMQDSLVQSTPQSPLNESVTTQTAGLEDDSLERDAGRDSSVDEGEDLNILPRDETAFEMREQVIGRRRLEYPVMLMQNELEEPRPRGEVAADADTSSSDSENVVECEGEKDVEL